MTTHLVREALLGRRLIILGWPSEASVVPAPAVPRIEPFVGILGEGGGCSVRES